MTTFDDNKRIKAYSTGVVIKRLLSYLKPYKAKFILSIIITLLVVLIGLIPAVIQGTVIGILSLEVFGDTNDPLLWDIANYFMNNYGITLSNFKLYSSLIIIASYVLVIIITSVISYKAMMILQKIGQGIIKTLREETFVHIESLSIAQINKNPIGKYVTRVTSDMAWCLSEVCLCRATSST